ncbi:MAG: PDZ domain-containing protein [Clostridia bacterium]|nr:PDZ domain-containing protein [Clostridia bacterium]
MPRVFPEKLQRLARKHLFPVLLILTVTVVLSAVFLAFPGFTNRGGHVSAIEPGKTNTAESRKSTEFPVADWQNAIIRVREKVAPAVVYIDTVRKVSGGRFMVPKFFRDFFGPGFPETFEGPEFEQRGTGSGFIINQEGHILTNEHVIRYADKITVTLKNGESFEAKVVGSNPEIDLAVIKIDAKKPLPYAELGDSDALQIGEWVVAIGNPFGFQETVTAGIISALNRSLKNPKEQGYLIQTDAAINPGNSGGPLVNLDGKVIGINEAIISNAQGMGFAIPINLAKKHLDELLTPTPPSPWLGIWMLPVNEELAAYLNLPFKSGVYVDSVEPDSPAAKAGLKPRDIIRELNHEQVTDPDELAAKIKKMKAGDKVTLLVWRNNEFRTFTATLATRP